MRWEFIKEAGRAIRHASTPEEARKLVDRYLEEAQDEEEREVITQYLEMIEMWSRMPNSPRH